MTFLYPTFLWALSLISIPIIIHLFNFRTYKTVYFSNVRFLQDIKQETKSQSQLRHIIILLLRILAIAALVIAFAQPVIPTAKNMNTSVEKKELVAIYLDNSYSMESEASKGKLIEIAKKNSQEIANSYRTATQFLFLTNDFNAKHQRFVNKEQVVEFVSGVETSSRLVKLSEVYNKVHNIFENKSNDDYKKTLYIISDFQKHISDFSEIKPDSSYNLYLVPLKSQIVNNLSIDSIWFETPGRSFLQNENLFIQVKNYSNEAYREIPLRLFMNDTLKSVSTFDIEEQNTKVIQLSYKNTRKGLQKGRLEIVDYPITFDNIYYFNYSILPQINVLEIYHDKPGNHFHSLFDEDSYIQLKQVNQQQVSPSDFSSYQVIILNEIPQMPSGIVLQISQYVKDGGVVIYVPDIETEKAFSQELMNSIGGYHIARIDTQKTRVKTYNDLHPVFRDVFAKKEENVSLPEIKDHLVYEKKGFMRSENILLSDFDHPILSQINFGKGSAYVFAMPFKEEGGNFARHPLFVPIIYNIAFYSQSPQRISYTIGNDNVVSVPHMDIQEQSFIKIKSNKGDFEFIPQQLPGILSSSILLDVQGNIFSAGHYIVSANSEADYGLSFNYNRQESALEYLSKDQIQDNISKNGLRNIFILNTENSISAASFADISSGKSLWRIFIIMALVFLAGEIAIIRLWR